MTLHYLANGAMRVRVRILKQEVFIPLVLILRALLPKMTDRDIYYHIANRVSLNSHGALFEGNPQCSILQKFVSKIIM